MYSFFFRRDSWAEILFLILRLIFFKDFSSAFVKGSLVGTEYPSANRVLFSSSVSCNAPIEPFYNFTSVVSVSLLLHSIKWQIKEKLVTYWLVTYKGTVYRVAIAPISKSVRQRFGGQECSSSLIHSSSLNFLFSSFQLGWHRIT